MHFAAGKIIQGVENTQEMVNNKFNDYVHQKFNQRNSRNTNMEVFPSAQTEVLDQQNYDNYDDQYSY